MSNSTDPTPALLRVAEACEEGATRMENEAWQCCRDSDEWCADCAMARRCSNALFTHARAIREGRIQEVGYMPKRVALARTSPPLTDVIGRRYRLRGQLPLVVEVRAQMRDTQFQIDRGAVIVRVVDRPLSGRGSRVKIGDEWMVTWSSLEPIPEVPRDP